MRVAGGQFTRREALAAGGAFGLATPLVARGVGGRFSWEGLRAEALRLAERPFQPPPPPAPAAASVDYDALDQIRYRADRTLLGRGGMAGIRLFPLSRGAARPVSMALVDEGIATPIAFSRDLFAGGERLAAGAEGFSGFRAMTDDGRSDWLAFQGASYFRAAGPLDQYGLSARALAIDTGLDTAEEFPSFTRFWLERSETGAIVVHALLDSPSAAGAWRFVNRRTPEGVVQEVSFVLQLRRDVARLGLAPLTSMFWYGEGNRARAVDWRPEIHDSDGLALLTGRGEALWRPLNDPSRAITNSFADLDPGGFGLLQRDRAFDHYQDDGVFYERRPSLWIEPRGPWGKGAVMLVELPTAGETADNIVAFWTPAQPATAGTRYALAYTMRWIAGEPRRADVARVVDTWRGTAGPPGTAPIPGATRLVADFEGNALKGLGRDSGVGVDLVLGQGKPLNAATYPVTGVDGRWRLIVEVMHRDGEALDLRACLRRGSAAMTETLLYQFL